MELMKDEKVILTSDTNELTLTTHRIRFTSSGYGFGNVISFLLSELDSCSITYKSNPIFLIIGALALIVGLVSTGQRSTSDAAVALFVVTVIMLLAYFFSRKSVLKLSSKSAHIFINVKQMSLAKVVEFIDTIELVKYNSDKK